jgi:hypothetical protein
VGQFLGCREAQTALEQKFAKTKIRFREFQLWLEVVDRNPSSTSRRTIMNMFVSTAAMAAAPAVAASPNSPDVVIDHRAILARVEEIIDLLRTRHIRDGWQMDEKGATRALAYFRRHIEGPAFKDVDEDTAECSRIAFLQFARPEPRLDT